MSLLRYITFMGIATALCWGAWITVLFAIDPQKSTAIGLILFYSSLILALTGTFAIIGFFVRLVLLKQELVFQKVSISFRQGIFFALLIAGFLFLQHMQLLTWYSAAFLIIGLTIAEFFMISRKPSRYRRV